MAQLLAFPDCRPALTSQPPANRKPSTGLAQGQTTVHKTRACTQVPLPPAQLSEDAFGRMYADAASLPPTDSWPAVADNEQGPKRHRRAASASAYPQNANSSDLLGRGLQSPRLSLGDLHLLSGGPETGLSLRPHSAELLQSPAQGLHPAFSGTSQLAERLATMDVRSSTEYGAFLCSSHAAARRLLLRHEPAADWRAVNGTQIHRACAPT